MSDLDLSRPISELFSNTDELRSWLREQRDAIDAELAQAPTPPPAPTPPAATEPDPLAERRAEAAAVRAEQEAQAQLVADARALLRVDLPAQGYHARMADEITDGEALSLAGMNEPTAAQRQAADDAATLADPARLQSYLNAKDAERMNSRWWSLAPSERREECARLGIDFEAADAQKRREMERF
jgi:hypothetical protein